MSTRIDSNRAGRGMGGKSALIVILGLAVAIPVSFGLMPGRPLVVKDPGIHTGLPTGLGSSLQHLTSGQTTVFNDGQSNFSGATSVFNVPNTVGVPNSTGGLGPRFNSNQCSSCHGYPVTGGTGGIPSSATTNNLFSVYQLSGATNTMPSFETNPGPTLVARFPFMSDGVTPDGTVHQLFTITGRSDAPNCTISQPTYPTNTAYRQPMEVIGDGFLEIIQNSTITANAAAECAQTLFPGICGVPAVDPHDGTIDRFGWKAQWRGLTLAAAEELSVQMGVTNEFFPTELDQTKGCGDINAVPESASTYNDTLSPTDKYVGDPERMGLFMRFLAAPQPFTFNPSAQTGKQQFVADGCSECHTVSYTTPLLSAVTQLGNTTVNLYSDLLLHHMGACLADNVIQGTAQGDMFRTPPLWGTSKRMYFLHDGRETDLLKVIQVDHACAGNSQYPASEAIPSVNAFNADTLNQQNILNFLRDL